MRSRISVSTQDPTAPNDGGGRDDEDDPPPGVKRWLVTCDESGIDGQPYYAFGTLWMPWQRRGDFAALIRELRIKHGFPPNEEFKWHKVSKRYRAFYLDLVELFFRTRWLAFHCIVVRRGLIDRTFHEGDWDLARRKHLTLLLTAKIKRCLTKFRNRAQPFRIWTDKLPSRYAKAHEAMEVIANNVLAKLFGRRRPVDRVIGHESDDTAQIQLCDLLLGAVADGWRPRATSAPKLDVARSVAEHLGWQDMRADTYPRERKFNVWYFKPNGKPREVEARRVNLKYPI